MNTSKWKRSSLLLLAAVPLVLSLPACAQDEGGDTADQTLTVLAAASLTEAFTAIAHDFESAHAGVTVNLSFESSSTLATQVVEGAAADVLATASPGSMQPVVDAGDADGQPRTFATNTVAIALPSGNPANVTTVSDVADPSVTVAVCVDTAPCGSVATEFFKKAGLSVTPVTEEVDVKSVLGKVVADEVDAGVVYNSDIVAAGDTIDSIPVPAKYIVSTDYLIATLKASTDSELAAEFVAAVQAPSGQQVLADAGFQTK